MGFRIIVVELVIAFSFLGACTTVGKDPDKVAVLVEVPARSFKVVALLDSGKLLSEKRMSESETLTWLKAQAAAAGADAIIEVTRNTMRQGVVVSSAAYGTDAMKQPILRLSGDDILAAGDVSAALKSYSVVYRAKAIRFD